MNRAWSNSFRGKFGLLSTILSLSQHISLVLLLQFATSKGRGFGLVGQITQHLKNSCSFLPVVGWLVSFCRRGEKANRRCSRQQIAASDDRREEGKGRRRVTQFRKVVVVVATLRKPKPPEIAGSRYPTREGTDQSQNSCRS